MSAAIGVMTRAPSSRGKTRLAPHLSDERLTSLRAAMLSDTLCAASTAAEVTIFFTPATSDAEIAACAAATPRVAQCDGDLGARMLGALTHLLETRGSSSAILVGSDIAMLTADHFGGASAALQAGGDVVLGPADDGGYYLIGMKQPHAQLFEAIEWGSDRVLADTLNAARRGGLDARLIRSAYDIDTIDDLLRLERDLAWAPAAMCPAVRRWFVHSFS